MKIEYEKDEEIKRFAQWLIGFGNHILEHSNTVVSAEIKYEPINPSVMNSEISFENACKMGFTLEKRAG